MKKLFVPFCLLALLAVVLNGCASAKKVPYLKNADVVDLEASRMLFDAKIMPKDLLTITVNTLKSDAAAPFNPTLNSVAGMAANSQGYLVDNDGNIDFPLVGRIHVAGLTKTACQDLIKDKILPYLSKSENPLVTVRMSSYRVTVLGEVKAPGVIQVTTEKMSLLEALAQAGDLTLYGKRDNVMLIREDASGKKTIHRLNLNDANIINSPYFYLQQNDVVYVEPNKVQARNSSISTSTTLFFSFFGIATSLTSLLFNVLRK